jgi:nucleoside-diphosphate-sugar epimerase
MKALVTGGGFLGRVLAEMLLGRGDLVRILSRQPRPDLARLGIEVQQGDVRDLDAVVRACMGRDAVFHAAAICGCWGDIGSFRDINLTGTQNVIVACKRRGVGRLIFTSCATVVSTAQDERGVDETVPYPPRFPDPCSETKALAEQSVLKANNTDGLLTCALRPCLLYGPRDPRFVPRLLSAARRGRLHIIGEGRNEASLLYIENAGMAHLLACDALNVKRVAGQAYFITDGPPVVFWDWVNALLKELGLPPAKRRVPVFLATGIARCSERWHTLLNRSGEPPLTRYAVRMLSTSHCFDIGKAQRDFAYRPIVSGEEALRRTAALVP